VSLSLTLKSCDTVDCPQRLGREFRVLLLLLLLLLNNFKTRRVSAYRRVAGANSVAVALHCVAADQALGTVSA